MSDRTGRTAEEFHQVDPEFVKVGKALDEAQEKRNRVQKLRDGEVRKDESCKDDCEKEETRKMECD